MLVELVSKSTLHLSPNEKLLNDLRRVVVTGDPGGALPKIEAAMHNYPGDPQLQKYAGILRYRRKEFSAAEPLLAAALAAMPADAEAAIFLMRVYYNRGSAEKCEATARVLLEMQPGNADAWRTLGRIYNRRRDLVRAADAWRHLAEVDSRDAEAPLQAARSYHRQSLFGDALEFAEKALALAPTNAEALRIKVEAAVALDRYETLLPIASSYFDLCPDQALALIQRLAEGKDLRTAAAMFATLIAARPAVETIRKAAAIAVENWRMQAIRYELERNDREAAICLCALRTLVPEDDALAEGIERIKGYFIAAMRRSLQAGDGDATIAAAESVLMVDPKAHEAWFAIGRARLTQNDPRNAVAPLRSACENDPENVWYLLNYARALLKTRELIAAVPVYRRVVALADGRDSPHSIEAKRTLDRLPSMLVARAREALSEGRPTEVLAVHELLSAEAAAAPAVGALVATAFDTLLSAVRHAYKAQSPDTRLLAERILDFDPSNSGVALILARTLMREKAYGKALPLWEKLSSTAPEEPHYHLQIARCHARLGDNRAAAAAARSALALDPAIDEAASIITRFQGSKAGEA